MKKLVRNMLAAAILAGGTSAADAAELYLVGDACQWGWFFNAKGNAMVETDTPGVFRGVTYISRSGNFKFLGQADWSGSHYLMKPDTKVENGVMQLVKGAGDNDGWKPYLADGMDEGNYEITVDTNNLTCTFKRAEYQDSPIWGKAIFMVGDAAPNGWAKEQGLPLVNTFEEPYIYLAANVELKKGSFKFEIGDDMPWNYGDNWAWLYKNDSDPTKFYKGQDGDSQWKVDEAGNYDVSVNSKTGEVKIGKTVVAAVGDLASDSAPVEYFTVSGVRVAEPVSGIYIRRQGNKVQKIAF